MVFSSLFFLYAFLPASLLVYALCRTQKAKNTSLLIFSLLFYAWGEPKYVLLLAAMCLFDWIAALRIQWAEYQDTAKRWLVLTVIVDLGLIGYFKYMPLFCSFLPEPPAFVSGIALPIGISFYTFQLLTYVVDVYRGDAVAEERYWDVLLYASLFHQCIAGPIVRYKTVAYELFTERDAHRDMASGAQRFAVGLAKKVVLANAMGSLADSLLLTDAALADTAGRAACLHHLSALPVTAAWVGIIAYGLQIYLDFSAYSDMAIGMGRMIGLHYLENFNYPYISRSVTEFWRRWHISLGTFFRDYVYIPLGGNRCSRARNVLNLFVVWSLTGLWHGASWNFVLWGLYFFVFLMLEKLFLKRVLDRLPVLSNLYLLVVVMCGWVFFRNTDITMALALLRTLFGLNGNEFSGTMSSILIRNDLYILIAAAFCSTPVLHFVWEKLSALSERSAVFGPLWQVLSCGIVPVVLLLISTMGLVGNSYNPFIYFRF